MDSIAFPALIRRLRLSAPPVGTTQLLILILIAGVSLFFHSAEAQSPTDLMPVYGVELNAPHDWVDSESISEKSNSSLDQVWTPFRQAGFNVIQVPVDVRGGIEEVVRLINVCVWAETQGVTLIPQLIDGESNKKLSSDFPETCASFAEQFLFALADADLLSAYYQVILYRLGTEFNHPGHNGGLTADEASAILLEAASRFRSAELEALSTTDVLATPIMICASFDFPLIARSAISGGTLTEEVFDEAYDEMLGHLSEVSKIDEVDVLGISWFPGSLATGGVERVGELVRKLSADIPGSQWMTVMGNSSAFSSADDQRKFFGLAFTNLADLSVHFGAEGSFLGAVFERALAHPTDIKTDDVTEDMKSMSQAEKASLVCKQWSGKSSSDPIGKWLKLVDNQLGMVQVNSDGQDPIEFSIGPGLEELTEIAGIVEETQLTSESTDETEAKDSSESSEIGEHMEQKVGETIIGLFDGLMDAIASDISGLWTEESSPSSTSSSDYSSASSTSGTPVVLSDPICEPLSISLADSFSCSAALTNNSNQEIYGLVAAIMDDEYVLGEEAIFEGINISAGGQISLELQGRPWQEGTLQASLYILDSSYNEIASKSLDPIEVGAYPEAGGSGSSGVSIEDISFGSDSHALGDLITCEVTLLNQDPDLSATDMILALVDEMGSALGEDAWLEEVAVAAGAAITFDLSWYPDEAGTFDVWCYVVDGDYNELDSELIGPIQVAQSSAGVNNFSGAIGQIELPKLPLAITPSARLFSLKTRKDRMIRLAYPEIGSHNFMGSMQALSGSSPTLIFPVTNRTGTVMKGFTATLLIDGKFVDECAISGLLPGQTRTLTFSKTQLEKSKTSQVEIHLSRNGKSQLVAVKQGVFHPRAKKAGVRSIRKSQKQLHQMKVRKPQPSLVPSLKKTAPKKQESKKLAEHLKSTRPNIRPIAAHPVKPVIKPGIKQSPDKPVIKKPVISPPLDRKSVTVKRPDLSIEPSSIKILSGSLRMSEEVVVTADIRNTGPGDAQNITAMLVISSQGSGGKKRSQISIPKIKGGAISRPRWRIQPPKGGPWLFKVSVMAAGDLNPANNTATKTFRPMTLR